MANLKIDNIEVEAGGAIIHPKNMYMEKFVQLLGKYSQPNNCRLFLYLSTDPIRNIANAFIRDRFREKTFQSRRG